MQRHFWYIANWKMQVSYAQAHAYMQEHGTALTALSKKGQATIVFCPSYESITLFHSYTEKDFVEIGSQDCSAHKIGAYTGQVSATSLAEIGCLYGIVGHSERLHYARETLIDTAKKARRLVEAGITPIICLGETKDDRANNKRNKILKEQADYIANHLRTIGLAIPRLLVAYEPHWAIGTNVTPQTDELQSALEIIATPFKTALSATSLHCIYGGSIDAQTAPTLKPYVDGFLIGRASTDFQTLKNIVLSSI